MGTINRARAQVRMAQMPQNQTVPKEPHAALFAPVLLVESPGMGGRRLPATLLSVKGMLLARRLPPKSLAIIFCLPGLGAHMLQPLFNAFSLDGGPKWRSD